MRRSGSVGPASSRPSISNAMRVKTFAQPEVQKRSSSLGRSSSIGGASASASKFGVFTSGGRMSGSTMSRIPLGTNRRATVRGFSSTECAKDPRSINDRAFKERCIRELVEFLTQRGYSSTISMKQLNSPSSVDFIKIFEFLMSFISPNYKINKKKVADDVPKVLKEVGYPFTIPKSYMVTVGAQHTWPTILAALSWLKVLIETSEGYYTDAMLFPRGENELGRIPERKLQYDFEVECYIHFMQGNDTFSDQMERMEKNLVCNLGSVDIDEDIDNLERELARNQLKLNQLENEPNELADLQDQLTVLHVELDKVDQQHAQLLQQQTDQQQQLHLLEEEEKSVVAELADALHELVRKEEIFAKQNRPGVDFQKLGLEHSSMRRRIAGLEADIEQCDKEILVVRKAHMNEKEQIERNMTAYNKFAENYQLIPVSAVNSGSSDLKLRVNFNEVEELNRCQVIRAALFGLATKKKDRCHALEEELSGDADCLDQLEELISDRQQQIDEGRSTEAQIDEQMIDKKESHKKTLEAIQAEIEAKKALLSANGQSVGGASSAVGGSRLMFNSVEEVEQDIQRIKQRMSADRSRNDEKIEGMCARIETIVTTGMTQLREHEADIDRRTDAFSARCQAVLDTQNKIAAEQEAVFQSIMELAQEND